MKIEGYLQKSGSWWAVEIPLLFAFTQGKTKKEAYLMAKESVEDLIDIKGFTVSVAPNNDGTFYLSSNNDSLLMALALKQQRLSRGLSIRDVASKLGSKSPTAYSRYEQGLVKPSLDKFSQLLTAIDQSLEPVLKVDRAVGE